MTSEEIHSTIAKLPVGHIIRMDDGRAGKRIEDAIYDFHIRRLHVEDDMVMGIEEGMVPFVTPDGELFLVDGSDAITLIEEPDIPQAFIDGME